VESKLDDIVMDPDKWIQNLELLRRRLEILGYSMLEMDVVIHNMHNLPKECETTIKFIENEREMETTTLERMKERCRTKFKKLNKSLNVRERALFNQNGVQKYKGLCRFCVIYGHRG
jgi:hypothetical protein